MSVQVENLEKNMVKLTIEVAEDKVAEALKAAYHSHWNFSFTESRDADLVFLLIVCSFQSLCHFIFCHFNCKLYHIFL